MQQLVPVRKILLSSKILFQQITVKTEEAVTYEFPCYRWLASNEGDGKLQRDLVPSLTFTENESDSGENSPPSNLSTSVFAWNGS